MLLAEIDDPTLSLTDWDDITELQAGTLDWILQARHFDDGLEQQIRGASGSTYFDKLRAMFGNDLAANLNRKAQLEIELQLIDNQQLALNPYKDLDGSEVLLGGDGDDMIHGGAGNDRISGDAGSDTIYHSEGNDTVFGGTDPLPQHDEETFASDDERDGQSQYQEEDAARDTYVVFGTDQQDKITIVPHASNSRAVIVKYEDASGNATQQDVNYLGIEVVRVNAHGGDDTVTVNTGAKVPVDLVLDGGDDNDMLDASTYQGDITIIGGTGDDTIHGGAGDDTLNGGVGRDELYGGSGNDRFTGHGDGDFFNGGADVNTLDYSQYGQAIHVFINSGWVQNVSNPETNIDTLDNIRNIVGTNYDDTLVGDEKDNRLDGGAGNDIIDGLAGVDTLIGGDGDDHFMGRGDGDDINGGGGVNTLDYSQYGQAIHAFINSGWIRNVANPGTNINTFDNIRNLIGTNHNDTLVGDEKDNRLDGGAGDDTLIGLAGSDFNHGGTGFDTIEFDAADKGLEFENVADAWGVVRAQGSIFVQLLDRSIWKNNSSDNSWQRIAIFNEARIVEASDRVFVLLDNGAVAEWRPSQNNWVETTGRDIREFFVVNDRLFVWPTNDAVWEFDFSDSQWVRISNFDVQNMWVENDQLWISHPGDSGFGSVYVGGTIWQHRYGGTWHI